MSLGAPAHPAEQQRLHSKRWSAASGQGYALLRSGDHAEGKAAVAGPSLGGARRPPSRPEGRYRQPRPERWGKGEGRSPGDFREHADIRPICRTQTGRSRYLGRCEANQGAERVAEQPPQLVRIERTPGQPNKGQPPVRVVFKAGVETPFEWTVNVDSTTDDAEIVREARAKLHQQAQEIVQATQSWSSARDRAG